jgi:O-antigen/teichoic acid export membrane protein
MLRRAAPKAIASAEPNYDTRGWTRVALPLLGVTLCLEVMRRADILIVDAMMDGESVGIFNVAKRIADLVTFFQLTVNGMAAPMISAAYSEQNRQRLQRLFLIAAHITFWPTLLLALCIAILSGPLLRLFGPEFAAARIPLLILLGAQLVNASCGLAGNALAMTGRERDCARVYAICAVLSICSVYVGVRVAGVNGAAFATAAIVIIWNVWLHSLSVRHLGVYPSVIAWFIRQKLWRRRPASGRRNSE